MKNLIFFLLLLITNLSYSQEYELRFKNFNSTIEYDKTYFCLKPDSNNDIKKKWHVTNNMFLLYNNNFYTTKTYCCKDTIHIGIENPTQKRYLLFFTEINNVLKIHNLQVIIVDKLKNRNFILENSIFLTFEINLDIAKTYQNRFYIIFKKEEHDKSSTTGNN